MNGNTVVTYKVPGLFKGEPNKVYEELTSIGETFTPQEVVDFAKNPDTELHKNFEWNDTIAANEWRKQQARVLIANIVVVDKRSEQPTSLRAIYHSNESDSYKPTILTVQQKDEYESLLEQARRELDAFERKYAMLGDLDEILRLLA